MKHFPKTYQDIFDTVDYCLKTDRAIPGLILIYSAIDSFSDLANRTSRKGRKVFMEWVKKWMLEKSPLPCSEVDIYSARCALLHSQTSESDLTSISEAREIYYVHGDKDVRVLQFALDNSQQKNAIALRIEDLHLAFMQAMNNCMMEINKDVEWRKIFNIKANKFLVTIN